MMKRNYAFNQNEGQAWPQICQLLLAAVLSSFIGAERELHNKAAGLRTDTLVGIGSALFMQISKFGFFDVLNHSRIVLDPSRIAAQIVSGIGFIGGGIIFKQQSEIRGLTTAAAVWLSAAVGAACGAGLPILASITTGLYFMTVIVYPAMWRLLAQRFHPRGSMAVSTVVRYRNWAGALETILEALNRADIQVQSVTQLEEIVESGQGGYSVSTRDRDDRLGSHYQIQSPQSQPEGESRPYRVFDVHLRIEVLSSANELVCTLSRLECVISVSVVREPAEGV